MLLWPPRPPGVARACQALSLTSSHFSHVLQAPGIYFDSWKHPPRFLPRLPSTCSYPPSLDNRLLNLQLDHTSSPLRSLFILSKNPSSLFFSITLPWSVAFWVLSLTSVFICFHWCWFTLPAGIEAPCMQELSAVFSAGARLWNCGGGHVLFPLPF